MNRRKGQKDSRENVSRLSFLGGKNGTYPYAIRFAASLEPTAHRVDRVVVPTVR